MAPAVGFNPNANPITHSSHPIWILRRNPYGIQILSPSLNLLHVHRMNIASSCLRLHRFVAVRRTISYSCRRAASGSIRDARLAGA
jgi:hypothetical protein